MSGNGRRPKRIYLYPRYWCSGGLVFPKREYAIRRGPHVLFDVVSLAPYPPPKQSQHLPCLFWSAFSHSPRPSSHYHHYHSLQYHFLKGQTHEISNSFSVFLSNPRYFQKNTFVASKVLLATYSETNLNPPYKYLFTFSTFYMSIFSSVQHLFIKSLSAKLKNYIIVHAKRHLQLSEGVFRIMQAIKCMSIHGSMTTLGSLERVTETIIINSLTGTNFYLFFFTRCTEHSDSYDLLCCYVHCQYLKLFTS